MIFPVEENTLYGPEVPRPIPFDEVDDMGLKWEDGSPPKSLEVGQKPSSDLFSDISTGSKFCGWVDLSCPLKQVITYGRMAGIRFIFNDGSEKFFGNIYNTHDSQTQIFDGISGESITGAYAITERGRQEEAIGDMYENSTDIESVTTQRKTPEYMRSLWVSD